MKFYDTCGVLLQEQTEVRKCLLSFGAESFVFQFPILNIKFETHRSIILPVLYGVKIVHSH